MQSPIGIFDSGYGGLTVFGDIAKQLPQYDYIYIGDNARAPYGNRSFETVYEYTKECVEWLFSRGCPLVIIACNTASAKALRSIQQKDLPTLYADKRVLGVIRPTAEVLGNFTHTNEVGLLGTPGTVQSASYLIEIKKFFPTIKVYQHACPLWVPFVENNEYNSDDIDPFIEKDLDALLSKSASIDAILLACTHYPLLENKIKKFLPAHIKLISQGSIVAKSLNDYLQRHPEMEKRLSRDGNKEFYTTDDVKDFETHGSHFFGEPVKALNVHIPALL